MAQYGCGICMYGKNQQKYNYAYVDCMIKNYEQHAVTDSCEDFKRDFNKTVVVKSAVKR